MVYAPHYLATFGGHLNADNPSKDIWQCNIRCVSNPAVQYTGNGTWNNTNATSEDPVALMNAVATKLTAWWATGAGSAGLSFVGSRSDATLEYLKFNRIAPGPNAKTPGVYADANVTHIKNFANIPGMAGASVPALLTCKYSWTTDQTRGLGAFGGVYPPIAFSLNGGASQLLLVASIPNHVTYAKSLLNCFSLNNVSNATNTLSLSPVIASAGSVKKQLPGANYLISGVRIGTVADVQRRRKNALVETYTRGAVTLAD